MCVFVDVKNLPVLPSVNVSIPAMRAVSLSGQERDGEQKDGGESGGGAEVQ